MITNQERIWKQLWLFGIVIDDDQNLASLGSYWNPEGMLNVKPSYYVPNDEDTIVSLVCLDGPRRDDNPAQPEVVLSDAAIWEYIAS